MKNLSLLVLCFSIAPALDADTGTASASAGAVLEQSTRAKRVTDPPPLAVVGTLEDGLAGSCTLHASNGGVGRKGVKATFDAILIDGNTGNTISNLGRRTGKTGRDGVVSVSFPIDRIGNFAIQAALLVDLNLGGGKKLSEFEFACSLIDETP